MTKLQRLWRASVGLLGLASTLIACGDDTAAPPGPGDYPAAIAPGIQWAGEDVILRWGGLGLGDPDLFADDQAVEWTRLDDTTAVVTLPNYVPAGTRTLTAVISGGEAIELGDVRLAGDAGETAVPIGDACSIYAWPRSAPVGFLGCDEDGNVLLAFPDGTTESFPGIGDSVWPTGFGVGLDEDVVVLQGDPGVARAWQLAAGGTLLGSLAAEGDTGPVFDLGAGRFVVLGDPESRLITALGDTLRFPTTEPWKVAVAPDRSYAFVLAWKLDGGLPVIDLGGPGALSLIAQIRSARAAVFTASSDTAYVAAQGTQGGGLYEIERSEVSGIRPTRWMDVKSGAPVIDLALDEYRGRVYYPFTAGDGLYLGVINRSSWRLEASPGGVRSATCAWCGLGAASVLDPDGRNLHVTYGWGASYRFELVP